MKRISLAVVLLALVPGIAQAYYYGGYYCGVRYSPYALSYYSSGLIPCGLQHSPYAVSYYGSALIDECTQYTPYAFSYYNSGLVPGYGICPYWDYGFPFYNGPVGLSGRAAFRGPGPARHFTAPSRPISRPARSRPAPRPARIVSPRAQVPHCDGMNVIRQHLRAQGLASMSIDRILRVDDQLLSVDILVRDRNLLIKYWNPEEVERLSGKDASKQRVYAKYKEDWERFAEQYKQTGGEIYTIRASEPETIVAALGSCPRLGPAGDGQTPAMYAKN